MIENIKIGDKLTYSDWGLILQKVTISPPMPKLNEIDIPGADGVIDLTESLNIDVPFERREIKLEFAVIDARNKWDNIYSNIQNYLHGMKKQIVFVDRTPDYYYEGRVRVDSFECDKRTAKLVIVATVDPYKLSLLRTDEYWLWDTFNFESGIIQELYNLEVQGQRTITVYGSRKKVVPEIYVSSNMTVTLNGGTAYSLTTGSNREINIVLSDGENSLTFSGNGYVSIGFRWGSL